MPKVLLADDSKNFLEIYKNILKGLQVELYFAEDGADAIKKTWKYKPDLVILDLEMPEMSGAECTRLIKQDPTQKNTPIVIVTKHLSQRDLEVMYKSGCEEILSKPFTKEQLLSVIKRYLKI
ncbi:MAG: response regulator [Thermoanaerobaculia bacterium]